MMQRAQPDHSVRAPGRHDRSGSSPAERCAQRRRSCCSPPDARCRRMPPSQARIAIEAAGAGVDIIIDLGADEFTRGRPHPMIDPAVRTDSCGRRSRIATWPSILLDVVIGFGAHADPAGIIAAALRDAPRERPDIVASVTGTEADPQMRSRAGRCPGAGRRAGGAVERRRGPNSRSRWRAGRGPRMRIHRHHPAPSRGRSRRQRHASGGNPRYTQTSRRIIAARTAQSLLPLALARQRAGHHARQRPGGRQDTDAPGADRATASRRCRSTSASRTARAASPTC